MWNTIFCNVFLRNMRIPKASGPETSLGRRAAHASLSEADSVAAAQLSPASRPRARPAPGRKCVCVCVCGIQQADRRK